MALLGAVSQRKHPYDDTVNEIISSSKNETVKRVARLKRSRGRRESGDILIEGPNLFDAMHAAGIVPAIVLATADDDRTIAACSRIDTVLQLVSDHVLASMADAAHPRSPVVVVRQPSPGTLTERHIVVMVDVADPGNAGTIIRTAAAFGWAVGYTPKTVDIWSPKTLRAGAGAHFATDLVPIGDLEHLGEGTHTVVAAVAGGGVSTVSTKGPYALLVGSEAHGLTPDEVGLASVELTIPMAGRVESLNVSVAAGIAMFHLSG
jgi:TrmH family RNA methyltransferase